MAKDLSGICYRGLNWDVLNLGLVECTSVVCISLIVDHAGTGMTSKNVPTAHSANSLSIMT